MTKEEVLDGLTNDLILLRLRRFFVSKGLPDGRYLLHDAELTEDESEGRGHKGKIEMVLPNKNRKVSEEQSSEDVRVVIDFGCTYQLDSNLSLDIRRTKPPIRRGKELIYYFAGILRPFEETTA